MLVLLTIVTVPALVAGFLSQVATLAGSGASSTSLRPDAALILVSMPLAVLLVAVSATHLRHRNREVVGLRRDVSIAGRTLAAMVDSADDAIVSIDAGGRITSWNRGAERLYGEPAADVVGRSFSQLPAPHEVALAESTLRRVLATHGRARTEAVHLRRDGSTFDAAATYSVILDEDGDGIGVSIVVRDVTDRNLAVRRLADSERRLRLLTESATDAVITADDRGRIVAWNPAAERIFGIGEAAALEATIMDLLVAPMDGAAAGSRPVFGIDAWCRLAGRTVAVEAIRAGGARFSADLSGAVYDDAGRRWYTAFVRDTTDRVRAEALAEEHLVRYQQLVERIPGVVYRARTGRGDRPDYVSPHIETLLGYTDAEWLAAPGIWRARIHPEDVTRVLAAVDAAEAGATDGAALFDDVEFRMVRRDGRVIWVRDHGCVLRDARGGGLSWSGVLFDVTERKSLEAQLVHQAFHDPLTGLANRALLGDRIAHALQRAARGTGLTALLMLDLDDFKSVNDTLGHETGDQLLQGVAERLREHSRSGSTVARLGGDEFAILLEDLDGEAAAVAVAARIVAAFEQPFRVGSKALKMRASVGVAVDGSRNRSAAWLLRSADLAMYEAKRKGKGCWQLYDPASYLAASKRLVLENELRRAVERGHFTLLYQPILDLRSGRITGTEALVRWNHRTLGLVPPVEFIAMLESTGMIVPVGEWVLHTASRQAAEWAAQFRDFRSMAVNVSGRQLASDKFPEAVARSLKDHELDPRILLLEVTESVALDPADGTSRRLERLRSLGVRIAVDDFGTGYSSLSYLRRLPIDTLKIDRSFVEGVGDDPEATAVARAIVDLARTLHLQTVAEGIESPGQAATLRALGCDLGQGFLFARPMAAAEMRSRLVNQAGLAIAG